MAARGEGAVLDADKNQEDLIKLRSGREIPARGEHSFFDFFSLIHHTFFDGKPTKATGAGFARLHTYDPKTGDCLIRREGRRTDQLAPYLDVELFGKTPTKEAVAHFHNMGGGLSLNAIIKQVDPDHPDRKPKLELKAKYRAWEWPIRGQNEDEFDRRERMWNNPHWMNECLSVQGHDYDLGGNLVESYNFETRSHRDDIHPHGCREKYIRDQAGNLEKTVSIFYSQGYISRTTIVVHEPKPGPRALVRQNEEIQLNHFHNFWEDQPRKRVQMIRQNGEVEESYVALTPEDLWALRGPELPRLSDHLDVLPTIEPAELKRLFDELADEMGREIIGSDQPSSPAPTGWGLK